MTSEAATADILASALLRRHAHDIRNKLSAVVSAVDVMGSLMTTSTGLLDDALDLLNESATDLRQLADNWSSQSGNLFIEQRSDIDGASVAAEIERRTGLEITGEGAASLSVRADPRMLYFLVDRVVTALSPSTIEIGQKSMHGAKWMTISVAADPQRAAELAESEPIAAVVSCMRAFVSVDREAGGFSLRMSATAARLSEPMSAAASAPAAARR